MITVNFHSLGSVEDNKLLFAVICVSYQGSWVWVKHGKRDTWEIPGGRREAGEQIEMTARRELYEETGIVDCDLTAVCEYSVTKEGVTTHARLYYALANTIGQLPKSEIEKIDFYTQMPQALTYPAIQPHLFDYIVQWLIQRTLPSPIEREYFNE